MSQNAFGKLSLLLQSEGGLRDTKHVSGNTFHIYLAGWGDSAADARVLHDAISRPNGLKIPQGNYYLVDSGYSNGEGFLSPYRGVRYHLKEWDSGRNSP
ncbi:UNVERIFIED_CONTAM: hypothetical protein Slati_2649700 [Sesamum latifolium]|uniref:Transposase n=1 Tax=Sesamum latifolium TaxID=2727402 RepID=A0AAW2VW55_9LAMI